MSAVNYLIGGPELETLVLKPFDERVMALAADFSAALLADPEIKTLADATALAFWSRRANLRRLAESYANLESRLGRGLAFHIAPANVPVNFAFSYLFGALAGNANLVRVPSRPFPQTLAIIRVLKEVLTHHPEIARRTAFVSYPADEAITAALSQKADVRLIWGGDETVARIRALSPAPRCVDICFPDRFSLALISTRALLEGSPADLKTLARNFYNDTYLIDQNACSSPQLVLFLTEGLSSEEQAQAVEKFWAAVAEEAAPRYHLQPASAVDKFVQSCRDSAELHDLLPTVKTHGNLVYRLQLQGLPPQAETRLRGSCGYFYEKFIGDLTPLQELITEKCQTLTYYGLDPEALRDLVISLGLRGPDRIVPVGAALDIGLIWDGHDLIREMSRIIEVAGRRPAPRKGAGPP